MPLRSLELRFTILSICYFAISGHCGESSILKHLKKYMGNIGSATTDDFTNFRGGVFSCKLGFGEVKVEGWTVVAWAKYVGLGASQR